jgi:hypothetical protein
VSLIAAAINEREHRRLVLAIASATGFREATRARSRVALAAFHPRRHVELVDFDRADEIGGWRVERSGELLDAPPKRPIPITQHSDPQKGQVTRDSGGKLSVSFARYPGASTFISSYDFIDQLWIASGIR